MHATTVQQAEYHNQIIKTLNNEEKRQLLNQHIGLIHNI